MSNPPLGYTITSPPQTNGKLATINLPPAHNEQLRGESHPTSHPGAIPTDRGRAAAPIRTRPIRNRSRPPRPSLSKHLPAQLSAAPRARGLSRDVHAAHARARSAPFVPGRSWREELPRPRTDILCVLSCSSGADRSK